MHFSPVAIARMVAVAGAVGLVAMQPRPDAALAAFSDSEAPLTTPDTADAAPLAPQPVAAPAPAPVAPPVDVAAVEVTAEPATAGHGVDDETVCLAKIVHHEAGNQPRDGQLAVAQVVINRLESPIFPKSICAIALQRNQFFNVHAYNPRQDQRWHTAVEIALDARNGVSAPVVGEALFFHAAYARPGFFRSRPRVAQIGDHIFYR